MDHHEDIIIGAGPAGLSAAYELVSHNRSPVVFEKAPIVGGIARTERQDGFYFDIGGHRFFTKISKINALWQSMLGSDLLTVPRTSRIYYKGRFFNYPLNVGNVLINLGFLEAVRIVLSYMKAQIHPHKEFRTFEEWVSNRFGERLYQIFFKTYTEKVWGIPCDQILSSWAEQRIKGLSLLSAVINAFLGTQNQKSLINHFYYPLKGPGMMWERFREEIENRNGRVLINSDVHRISHADGYIERVHYRNGGRNLSLACKDLISSIPISGLIHLLDPPPPATIISAADNLSYRSFIVVVLIVERKDLFPDQWMYIHSSAVRVGRIQNFKNWSPAMVPDPTLSSVGMEYFCDEGDHMWRMPDEELTTLAVQELASLELAAAEEVSNSFIVRQPKAYPIYNESYKYHLQTIRTYLDSLKNLQTIGRNGMHRYNNMDHSMYTGLLAAQNIMGAKNVLWDVNDEEEYLEEQKDVPERSLAEAAIGNSFRRMDKLAFATACGFVSGLLLFIATIWLLIKGGEVLGPNLQLLENYFIGYSVSVPGAFFAFVYTFCWSFLFGWLFAYTRNLVLAIYLFRIKSKADFLTLRDFFDSF